MFDGRLEVVDGFLGDDVRYDLWEMAPCPRLFPRLEMKISDTFISLDSGLRGFRHRNIQIGTETDDSTISKLLKEYVIAFWRNHVELIGLLPVSKTPSEVYARNRR